MEKEVNLLGIRSKKAILCHSEVMKGVHSYIIMEEITEEEELRIDKSHKYYGEKQYERKDGIIIQDKNIYIYGEVNLKDENDINIITSFNLINHDYDKNWVHSNFDYERGVFTTIDGVAKTYPTSDPILWFKYNHCLIGKPKRIIIYKRIKTKSKC